MGPVAPLLAIYEIYKQHDRSANFFWVGTRHGPEKELVETYNIPYFSVTSGKLRRYYSLWNLVDIFKIFFGFFQSIVLLIKYQPDLVISAGGFVSVPLHYAAALLGIPAWIHQQDAQAGLANRLMAPVASQITCALADSQNQFKRRKIQWIGNPVRDLSVPDLSVSRQYFDLPNDAKVILAFGGGTGSEHLNSLIIEALPHLPSYAHIIHLTGRDRPDNLAQGAVNTFKNYHPYKFLTSKMKDAYAVADLIIGRGGFVTITESASLAKPTILIPMNNTHQEKNVLELSDKKAVIMMDEKKVNGLNIAHAVKKLLDRPDLAQYLGEHLREVLPPARADKVVEIVEKLIK